MNDPAGDVLVELGSSDYLKRYKTYVSHVQEWRQQFQKLESVNLRYDNQVIVNPDMEGRPKQPALAASAARAAAAAGVKPAALITRLSPTRMIPRDRTLPKPAFELTEKKLDPKAAAAKKPAARTKTKKTAAKTGKAAPAKKVAATTSGAKSAPAAGHAAAQKPQAKRPSATASAAIPKPSAAIAKQQTNANPN